MKTTTALLVCTLIALALIILEGCGKNDPDPLADATNKITSKTWTIKTVSIDGKDVTADFSGLTLKFSSSDYTTTNGHVVWPTSGTWKFKEKSLTEIIRSDDVEVTVDELTGSSLALTFYWSKTSFGGRVGSVKGSHSFVFQ
ncbi:hypothetical protein WSM22_06590 [Cytophagales bacterium WSM2-2]|nr:hypothetical protein WSM22_06590 [Cytophagales bacterium WSM2-2]